MSYQGLHACPSCGSRAPAQEGLPLPPVPATPECWDLFGRLTAYDLERGRPDFPHQHVVDAYAVQHTGPPAKPVALWFGLVGLHLAFEHGWTGRQVQVAHGKLARLDTRVPDLPLPAERVAVTVSHVLNAAAGDERDTAIVDWASSVWRSRRLLHDAVAEALPPLSQLR